MTPILIATEISKSFDTGLEILKGISLSVHPGETLAVMGPSGVGKSTLLHILATLEKPTSGNLVIAGQTVTSENENAIRNKLIGFIFQGFHLLEESSAFDNVLLPAKIARKSTAKHSEAYERAHLLLEKMGLEAKRNLLVKHLSGGEKQKVTIARALLNDPPLIFADEPSGNLDSASAKTTHDLLIACAADFQKALIIVTHNKELAELCHRVFLLKNGSLIAT